MNNLLRGLLFATALLSVSAQAVVVRGTGTTALVGNDLTDPENNGSADTNLNYNATFRANNEAGFGGGEFAYNVFDNRLGGSNDKWCCDMFPGMFVEANFGAQRYVLTSFTASSANDIPGRDADIWQIRGSNDGINYTTIFSYNHDGVSPWAQRLQVNQYFMGTDYAAPAAYSIFQYQVMSTVSGEHQLGELEFFSTAVPEPGMISLLGLGLAGLAFARRKKQA
jgi:hypothetical protein